VPKIDKNYKKFSYKSTKKIQPIQKYSDFKWCSFSITASCLLQNRDALITFFERQRTNFKDKLTPEDWSALEGLVPLLDQLTLLVEHLQSDSNATISLVVHAIHRIRDLLTRKEGEFGSKLIQEVKKAMLDDFIGRWSNIDLCYYVAALLDPRTKSLNLCSTQERNCAIQELRSQLEKISIDTLDPEDQISVKRRKLQSTSDFLFSPNRLLEGDELSTYLTIVDSPTLELNTFEWWRGRKDQFPRLYQLARRYLQIPASSATLEQTFSVSKAINEELRRSPQTTNEISFQSLKRSLGHKLW